MMPDGLVTIHEAVGDFLEGRCDALYLERSRQDSVIVKRVRANGLRVEIIKSPRPNRERRK